MELEVKGMTKIESNSSIEVNKNSKGVTWSIKAYGSNSKEIEETLKELKVTVTKFVKELETP